MEIKYGVIWYTRHICVCHFFFGHCVEVSGATTLLFLEVTSMFLLTPKVRDPGLSNQLLKVTPTHPALSLFAAVIACHTDSLAPRKPHEIPTPSTPGLVSEERGGSSWGWQGTAVCLGETDGSPGAPGCLAKPQRQHPTHLCISLLSSCWVNLNPSWPGPTSLAMIWLPPPLRSPLGPLPHPSFCSSRSSSKPGHSCPDTVHFLLLLPGTLFPRRLHSSLTPCFIQVSIPISSHPRVSLACVVFSHFSYI